MSSKSHDAAGVAIARANFRPERFLCMRMFQNRISDSVYTLLKDKIYYFSLEDRFNIFADAIEHKYNGSLFRFYGLARNVDEIKSFEGATVGWVEEAHNLTQTMFDTVRPTIMRNDGAEMWMVWNPKYTSDFIWQRLIVNPPAGTLTRLINYTENPFLGKTALADIESSFEEDDELARHIYLGVPLSSDENSAIPYAWIEACVDLHIDFPELKLDEGQKAIGFDVADEGTDFNARALGKGSVVLEMEEWRDKDPNSAAQKVFSGAVLSGATEIIFDSIGVGAGAKGELRNRVAEYESLGKVAPTITPWSASGSVVDPEIDYMDGQKNKDVFSGAKSQAWWEIRDRAHNAYRLRSGTLTPNEKSRFISFDRAGIGQKTIDKMLTELSTPIRQYVSGKIQIESKKDMKKRGIPSPNLADSVVMLYAPRKTDISSLFFGAKKR